MATIGKWAVQVSADTSEVTKGFDAVQASAKRTQDMIGKTAVPSPANMPAANAAAAVRQGPAAAAANVQAATVQVQAATIQQAPAVQVQQAPVVQTARTIQQAAPVAPVIQQAPVVQQAPVIQAAQTIADTRATSLQAPRQTMIQPPPVVQTAAAIQQAAPRPAVVPPPATQITAGAVGAMPPAAAPDERAMQALAIAEKIKQAQGAAQLKFTLSAEGVELAQQSLAQAERMKAAQGAAQLKFSLSSEGMEVAQQSLAQAEKLKAAQGAVQLKFAMSAEGMEAAQQSLAQAERIKAVQGESHLKFAMSVEGMDFAQQAAVQAERIKQAQGESRLRFMMSVEGREALQETMAQAERLKQEQLKIELGFIESAEGKQAVENTLATAEKVKAAQGNVQLNFKMSVQGQQAVKESMVQAEKLKAAQIKIEIDFLRSPEGKAAVAETQKLLKELEAAKENAEKSMAGGQKAAEGWIGRGVSWFQGLSNQTQAAVGGLAASLSGSTGILGSAMGAIVAEHKNPAGLIGAAVHIAVQGFRALAQAVTATFNSLANLHTESQRLGVTAESLAGLRMAAEDAGVSNDQLAQGLNVVNRRFGEMRQSLGAGQVNETAMALERLGLNAQSVAGMSVDDALTTIGERLATVTDASQRSAIQFQILGRQAEGLAPIFDRLQGGGEVGQWREIARLTGQTLNADQAAQMFAATDAAGEALQFLATIPQSFLNSIAIAAAPAVEMISNVIKEAVLGIQPLLQVGRDIAGAVFTAVGAAVQVVIGVVRLLAPVFNGIIKVVKALWDGIKGLITGALAPVVAVVKVLAGLVGGVLSVAFQAIGTVLGVVAKGIGAFFSALMGVVQFIGNAVLGAIQLLLNGIAGLTGTLARIPLVGRLFGGVASGARAAADQIASMRAELNGAGAAMGELAQAAQNVQNNNQAMIAAVLANAQNVQRTQILAGTMTADPSQLIDAGLRLREMLQMSRPAQATPEANADAARQINQLQEQVALAGMSADAAARWRLEQQGVAPELVNQLAALQRIAEAQAAAQAAREAGNRFAAQIDEFGMSARQAEIHRLAQQGVNEELLNTLRIQDEMLSNLEAQARMQQEANRITQQYQDPVERASNRLAELQEMFNSGALDFGAFSLAAADVANELDRAAKVQIQSPKALEQGSSEAISAINAARNAAAANNQDPAERMARLLERAQEQRAQQLALARAQLQALQDNGLLAVQPLP